jgi:hypothetical protein
MAKYGEAAEKRQGDPNAAKAKVISVFSGARLRKRTPEEKARVIYQHKNGAAS